MGKGATHPTLLLIGLHGYSYPYPEQSPLLMPEPNQSSRDKSLVISIHSNGTLFLKAMLRRYPLDNFLKLNPNSSNIVLLPLCVNLLDLKAP